MAIAGIVTLAFITMAIVAAVFPEKSPASAGPGSSTEANPFPPLPSLAPSAPTEPAPGATSASPTPGRTPASPRTTTRPATTPTVEGPTGAVSAVYSRAPERTWETGFQASVTLRNNSASAESWQVTVVFEQNVSPTQERWINGADQPTMSTQSHGATYIGTAPIPPGSEIVLWFGALRQPGNLDPLSCTVNGRPCSIN